MTFKLSWDGTPTEKLLIDNHFGLGDQIQCWRYVPETFKDALDIWFRCDEELIPLFKYKYPITLVGKDEALKEVSFWNGDQVDMSELVEFVTCQHLETTGTPYLKPNARYFNQSEGVIKKFSGLKVGVCWCGNPANPRDDSRSCNPKHFEQLEQNGVTLFSLQKHVDPPFSFRDLRPFMDDLNQTAYLIMDMDLVITVDTSVAHLAGALGKEVWMLLADPHDVRWPVEGSKTPLYDSMRIFRKEGGNWGELLEKVALEI